MTDFVIVLNNESAVRAFIVRAKVFLLALRQGSAVIGTRTGANEHYYGRPVSADDILRGRVAAPPGAASLRAALGR